MGSAPTGRAPAGDSTRTSQAPTAKRVRARISRTGTPRARAAATTARQAGSQPSTGSGGSSSTPTGIRASTSTAPPTWSRESWVSTRASSRRTPARRSAATTGAGDPGGPVSTTAAAPSGLRSRIASP